MSRKPVVRKLPDLDRIHYRFDANQNHQEQLYVFLLKIIRRVQGPQAVPFYAMRTIMERFGVHYTTVRQVYRRLAADGVLRLVRGSQTLVEGRHLHRSVRGVVAVPVWFPGLVKFAGWRQFYSRLDDELRRHDFVSDFIFFGKTEFSAHDYPPRILAHRPDYVVWYDPMPAFQIGIETLFDRGLKSIVVASKGPPFCGERYRLDYDATARQAMKEWRRDGIVTVQAPRKQSSQPNTFQQFFWRGAVADAGLEHAFPCWGSRFDSGAEFIRSLAEEPDTGVIFDEWFFFFELCIQAPQAMADLFRRRRTLLMLPHHIDGKTRLGNAKVDMLAPDWEGLAVRIARELANGKVFERRKVVGIPALWQPQVEARLFWYQI